MREASENTLVKAYEELCTSYHAIEDFRAKLLGLLPLASGTGVFLLITNIGFEQANRAVVADYLAAVGLFGFVVTIGLFFYELRGIQRCNAMINQGKSLEDLMGIQGQFTGRPAPVNGFIGSSLAARIIYPAVLGAWAYMAFALDRTQVASLIAAVVFLSFFAGSFLLQLDVSKSQEP